MRQHEEFRALYAGAHTTCIDGIKYNIQIMGDNAPPPTYS